jgi:YgiT-type zinc finger domain-containing protein
MTATASRYGENEARRRTRTIDNSVRPATDVRCPFCGAPTHEDVGTMTLSVAGEIIIIEDVPARICNGCMEQFYGEDALHRVERLRAGKFQGQQAVRVVTVPVFRWQDLEDR